MFAFQARCHLTLETTNWQHVARIDSIVSHPAVALAVFVSLSVIAAIVFYQRVPNRWVSAQVPFAWLLLAFTYELMIPRVEQGDLSDRFGTYVACIVYLTTAFGLSLSAIHPSPTTRPRTLARIAVALTALLTTSLVLLIGYALSTIEHFPAPLLPKGCWLGILIILVAIGLAHAIWRCRMSSHETREELD